MNEKQHSYLRVVNSDAEKSAYIASELALAEEDFARYLELDEYRQLESEEQVVWKWHRVSPATKSHLLRRLKLSLYWSETACGLTKRDAVPNGDMSDPCLRCLKAAKGKGLV